MPEAVLAIKNIYAAKRKAVLTVLKILISAALLIFILHSVEISAMIAAFENADKLLILAAFSLSFFNIYLQYLKWRMVSSTLLKEDNRIKVITSLFYGFTAGSFTPARAGEYVGRTIPFSDKPLLQVSAAVLIDKLFSLFMVLIFGSFAFMLYLSFSILSTSIILLTAGVLSYLLLLLIKKKFPFNKYKLINNISNRLSYLKNIDIRFGLKLAFISLLFYACFIIQFVILIGAFSNHFDFTNYIWTANLVMFVKTIIPQVSIGELGVREGASVYFLKHFGETAAVGFNASVFLFLINVLIPALTGLILFLRKK
jgi:uncharacterized membrane protein YbhN (UPF0104 family)